MTRKRCPISHKFNCIPQFMCGNCDILCSWIFCTWYTYFWCLLQCSIGIVSCAVIFHQECKFPFWVDYLANQTPFGGTMSTQGQLDSICRILIFQCLFGIVICAVIFPPWCKTSLCDGSLAKLNSIEVLKVPGVIQMQFVEFVVIKAYYMFCLVLPLFIKCEIDQFLHPIHLTLHMTKVTSHFSITQVSIAWVYIDHHPSA